MSGDGSDDAAVPAASVINQTMPLEVVAQQESTRSYFLAQTLESTRTVPIVSANLPLDKGTTDEVVEPERPAEGDSSSEDEGGEDSDESDLDASDGAIVTPGVSAESTVVGSFEYRGIAYAVEPGGESVAVVAADYAKLPEEFIDAQTIVLPSMVTSDGLDFYTVSRIADYAFAGINGSVAVATQNGQDADASSSMQAQAEACAYRDDATAESSESDDVAVDAAVGITTVTIPASIVEIGDDAFTGADTLQYVVVSPDNPTYSQYDGCLYDADQTCLLLIPEGRLGAVWVPSTATTIPADVSSHCASVTSFIVEPNSAASQLLAENAFYNANDELIEAVLFDAEDPDSYPELYAPDHDEIVAALGSDDEIYMPVTDETTIFATEEQVVFYAVSDTDRQTELYQRLLAKYENDRFLNDDSETGDIVTPQSLADGAYECLQKYGSAQAINGSAGNGAFWAFAEGDPRKEGNDGVLTLLIWCEGGASVKSLYETATQNTGVASGTTDYSGAYWGPTRPYVERIVMLEDGDSAWVRDKMGHSSANVTQVKAILGMSYWFCDMTRLVATDEVYLVGTFVQGAEPATSCPSSAHMSLRFRNLFRNCLSLEVIDENVLNIRLVSGWVSKQYAYINMSGMFVGCTALKEVRSGTVPNLRYGTTACFNYLGGLFSNCISLSKLPEGFNAQSTSTLFDCGSMFANCPSLVDLPSSFNTYSMRGQTGSDYINTFVRGVPALLRFTSVEYDPVFVKDSNESLKLRTYYRSGNIDNLRPSPQVSSAGADSYWKTNYARKIITRNANQAEFFVPRCEVVDDGITSWISWRDDTGEVKNDDGSNGGYTVAERTVYDGLLTEPSAAPTSVRSGFAFDGWYDNPRYEGSPFDFSQPVGDYPTLWAKFVPLYDVVFDTNDGAFVDGQSRDLVEVKPSEEVTMPSAPEVTYPGYEFDCWVNTASGELYEAGKAYTRMRSYRGVVNIQARWRYIIELNTNAFNSDNETDALSSDVVVDLSTVGAIQADEINGQHYVEDDHANRFLCDTDGNLQRISAVYKAPLKLPTVKNRTGYDETNAWGVKQSPKGKGVAEGVFAMTSDHYTADAEGGKASDIAIAKLTFHDGGLTYTFADALDPATENTLRTYTLYAAWTGKAKTYDVRLVSQYADGSSYDFKSNPQTQDITVTYDAAVPTAGITKPVYQVNSTPTNLVFLGFTSRPNGAYSANSGAAMQGTQFVTITNDAAQTPTAMTDNSTNKVVDFRFTYDSDGIDLSDGKIVLYALWGYPQVDIEFDLQDASLNGELTPNKVSQKLDESGAPLFPGVYYQTLTTNDLMPDLVGLLNRHKNGRSGFVFNGFWTTKYTEAEGAKESIDGKDVEAVQYYDATGKCVYDPNEDGISTWDKTYGTKLYAHWQYRVYLDLNVFNSDGEAVLNADKSDFDVSAAWPSTRPSVVEQKDFATELQYKTGSVLVEDSAAVAQQYTLPRYGFTAIDGAPIQLPTLIDRKGYTDTRGWGTMAGSFGAATDIQAVDTDNVKAAFRLTPADLVTVTSDTTSTGFDNKAYVLHANWRAEKKADGTYADALSGHPITYKVALHASYAGDTQEDSFQATDNALDVQTFEVVYDSPIDVTDANAKLKPYATDPADEATINYVDATKDDNNALRNLVLQGFYTQKSTVAAHAGKAYVKVSSNRFSVADGAKQSGVIAFREVPAAGDTVDLYAWWTYNSMTVSFDLQGGRIDGLNDPSTFVIEGVVSHGDVPDIAAELGTVYDNAPGRSGYVFAGWWNTKYNERTAETIDGVTVNPKKYYDVTAADPDNVHDATDDGVWQEYTNTTLYAHWKYTIAFDKQLDPASDLADVTLDAVKADNDAARISAVVMLTTGDARAAGASGTDLYGNEYVVTTTGDASKNGEVSDLAITAIAGAPVQLPQAQNRRMDVGNSSYEKIGYEASRDWRTDLKQPDELLAHDDGAAEQYFFTKLDDSWTGAGYADPAAVPCKLGKSTTADGGATLVLYAKWTPKPFYVKLNYSYETDGTAYTSTHGDDLLKVTYDQDDYQYVNASGVPIASRDEAWPDLLPVDSSRTSATAQVAGEADPYDNLDFTGIATAPNAFKSNAGTGFVRQGDLYWSKNSTPEANAKNAIERFRAVRGEAGADKAPGAYIDTNNAANPFDMYVIWAQPTREITFDLSADAEDGTPTLAATTLERMKGDTVDAGGATDPAAKLTALADEVTGLTSRSNYVFGGFWTTPYQESLYTDEAGQKVQPVCYYTLQNGKLVAAKPDASIEGGTGPWLSEHNASSVWLEDEATTLYAHWKYRIAFANDYTIPNTSEKDMLQFGADTVGSYGGAQVSVPFQEVDAAGYADANGYVTLSAPLNLPVDQNSQGYNAIGRIRDFGKAAGYDLTGRGPTGYEFAGWSLDAGTDGAKTIVSGLNAAGELTDAMALAPQQRGLTTLYAQWTALPFTIEFDYYPDNLYADAITDHSVNEAATGRGTRAVTVLYDQSLKTATGDDTVSANGAITPPTLYGFEFLGYYATNDGKVEANGDVTGAGRRFYNAPLPQDAGTSTDDGLSQPNDGAWFTSELSVVNGKGSTKLYAYYQQKEFTLHFSTWDSEDGTLQEPTGNVESQQHYDQKWHYGDKLRVVEGDAYQASGTADLGSGFPVSSTDTFTRRGYTFTGWYFYPAENDPQYVGESESAKAARAELHANPANRVYVFRCDATNLADVKRFPGVYTYDAASGQWVQSSVTTWRTSDLFDAEQNYTLYAGWEPKDYEVTFKARCPETTINDEVKTFSYGQVLQPTVDLTQVGELGKPYTFIGWNTQPDAKSTTKTGWLFDKTNYVQGGDDTTDNPALSIMDPTRGGVFMPNDTPRGITYYGIWEEPGEHRVVLFSGPHGTLKQGSTELAYANSIGYRYRLGVSDISKANLNDSYGLTLSEDTGYRFVGWAELSPAQLGVSGYDDLPATSGIDTFAQGLVNGGVNDIAVNTTHYFPNSYNASDKQETYVNPYTNAKPGFRDIYLIAVYELINDYLITLDLGDAATYSDKKDNIELGARIVDSVFQPTENASMPDELLYAYGFDVTKGDFALPEPVSGMHDFQGWELLGSDGAWTPVGKDVRIDVKEYADAALNEEAMAKRTYRAVWTPKQFTIRFTDVNRNIPVEMDDVVYTGMTYGETFKLPYPATRETGYPFSYWRLVCDDGYFVGRFAEGTEFDLRELLYAMRMGESYQGVYMGEVTMIDNEIVFDSVWGDTISVEVPVQALIKVDWDTGDILTQSGLSLKTRNRTDDIKVVSLRHDRLTTDAEHDESGAHLFGDEAGKVYLSVHTGMVAEDGAESGLFFKQNVDAATGRVLSGVVEQYDPLLIDLAKDAIIMENYPFAVGEAANAYKPVGASFDLYDANQTLTSEYGFRVFNQTDKGALPVRFSLLFAGGAKPSDFAGLTALGHESTASIPVAQLHYTVQKAN